MAPPAGSNALSNEAEVGEAGEEDAGLPCFVVGNFEEWYRRIWPRLVAFAALQCGGRADVGREAAAAAAAKAYESWDSGRIRDPDVWVHTVVLNELRRSGRRRALERRAWARFPPRRVLDSPEVADPRLVAAVEALPKRQRTAVVLRYQSDLSQSQIAEAMGVAPGTVSALLAQARQKLRLMLEEQNGDG